MNIFILVAASGVKGPIDYCQSLLSLPESAETTERQNPSTQFLMDQQQPNNPEQFYNSNPLLPITTLDEYNTINTNQSGFNLNRLGNGYYQVYDILLTKMYKNTIHYTTIKRF